MLTAEKMIQDLKHNLIEALDINQYNGSNKDLCDVAKALTDNTSVTKLSMSAIHFLYPDQPQDCIDVICDTLMRSKTLKEIYCIFKIGASGEKEKDEVMLKKAKLLIKALKANTSITTLTLELSNPKSGCDLLMLETALSHQTLTSLTLKSITSSTSPILALLKNNRTLQTLTIDFHDDSHLKASEAYEVLGDALSENSSLTTLNMKGTLCVSLVESLGINKTLKTFTHEGPMKDNDTLLALVEVLKINKNLLDLKLHLGCAVLVDVGLTASVFATHVASYDKITAALAQSLAANNTLKRLALRMCITNTGAQSLMQALSKKTMETILHLYSIQHVTQGGYVHQNFSAELGEIVAGSLANNTSIVELTCQMVSASALATFFQALAINQKLKKLIVHCNIRGPMTQIINTDGFSKNTRLEELAIYGTAGDQVIMPIANALKINKTLRIFSYEEGQGVTVAVSTALLNALQNNETLVQLNGFYSPSFEPRNTINKLLERNRNIVKQIEKLPHKDGDDEEVKHVSEGMSIPKKAKNGRSPSAFQDIQSTGKVVLEPTPNKGTLHKTKDIDVSPSSLLASSLSCSSQSGASNDKKDNENKIFQEKAATNNGGLMQGDLSAQKASDAIPKKLRDIPELIPFLPKSVDLNQDINSCIITDPEWPEQDVIVAPTSVLFWACFYNYTWVVELLLQNGVDPNSTGGLRKGYVTVTKATPLMIAIANAQNLEIVELLLRYQADITRKDSNGCTALDWAMAVNYAQPQQERAVITNYNLTKINPDGTGLRERLEHGQFNTPPYPIGGGLLPFLAHIHLLMSGPKPDIELSKISERLGKAPSNIQNIFKRFCMRAYTKFTQGKRLEQLLSLPEDSLNHLIASIPKDKTPKQIQPSSDQEDLKEEMENQEQSHASPMLHQFAGAGSSLSQRAAPGSGKGAQPSNIIAPGAPGGPGGPSLAPETQPKVEPA